MLGAALIGVSFGLGGFFANPMTFKAGATIGLGAKAAFGIGAALALSGVQGMLFPIPEIDPIGSESDPRVSFSFSGLQNTSRAGTPVPICYGEILTGSVVISGSVTTDEVEA